MDTKQALSLITEVCHKFIGTRQDHINIEQALLLIESDLQKLPKEIEAIENLKK